MSTTITTPTSWLIIGISGISCSGKSTLAKSLYDYFNNNIDTNIILSNNKEIKIKLVKLIKQDDYFWPKTSANRVWIDELNYCNRENLNSLDMITMCNDLNSIVDVNYQKYNNNNYYNNNNNGMEETQTTEINILIIEGFLIFIHPTVRDLCQIKIQLMINYENLIERRKTRVYNPATPTGYLQYYVWPTYQKHLQEIQTNLNNVKYYDTNINSKEQCFADVLEYIKNNI